MNSFVLMLVMLLQEGMAYDIIVATTKIVNGSTLTETFVEKLGWLATFFLVDHLREISAACVIGMHSFTAELYVTWEDWVDFPFLRYFSRGHLSTFFLHGFVRTQLCYLYCGVGLERPLCASSGSSPISKIGVFCYLYYVWFFRAT